jgi:hypothetical protein
MTDHAAADELTIGCKKEPGSSQKSGSEVGEMSSKKKKGLSH